MSGAGGEIGSSVQEARDKLAALLSARSKATAVRVLGTLLGLAIAMVFVYMFITLITGGLNMERITEAVREEITDKQFQGELRLAATNVAKEVYPDYLRELKKKALDSGMTDMIAGELIELVKDVGPVYLTGARQMMAELALLPAFGAGMKEVAAEVGPAYRKELDRVAPEVFVAVQDMRTRLLTDLSETTQAWLADCVKESLEKNKVYLEERTNLTPAVVEKKLVDVVVAAEAALVSVVKKRTDRYQTDLDEIQAMLDRIPESKEKDPDKLLDEIGKVSLALMKVNLPDYQGQLEW